MTTVSRTVLSFSFTIAIFSLVIAGAAGCDRSSGDPDDDGRLLESDLAANSESPPPRREPAKAPEADPEEEDPPPADTTLDPVVEAPPLAPPDAGLGGPEVPQDLGDLLPSPFPAPLPQPSPADEAIERAIASAESPASTCERTFALLRELALAANRAVPRRAAYLEACEVLPEAMQRCLDPAYREQNEQECLAARATTPPENLERLRRVVELEEE